jgi:hypothetical protein
MTAMIDSLLTEIREQKEALAKEFGYDLAAICKYLRERQVVERHQVVSFADQPSTPLKETKKPDLRAAS